jgi:hypothetical protein
MSDTQHFPRSINISQLDTRFIKLRFIGYRREKGEGMGVLGGLRPPNTPIFLSHHGNSYRALITG